MTMTRDGQLVGREPELRRLLDALEQVQAGGVTIGVWGEPGVGKTALLAGVEQQARTAGFTVLTARGRQSEINLPFASLHQLIYPLLSRVDTLPSRQREALLACFAMSDSTEANPFFTFLAVLELLVDAAAAAPVLISLDDAHLMDPPSVDVLAFVARRLGGERIVLLCSASAPSAGPFGDDPAVNWIEITGLDEAASLALLTEKAPMLDGSWRERVVQHASGNPLALIEFAAALEAGGDIGLGLDDELPMTTRLERAFVGRAERLDPDARKVLDVAALDDGESLSDVLAAARLLSAAPIEAAVAHRISDAGLIVIGTGSYHFSHSLIRSALRHAMSPSDRRRGHGALGEALSAYPDRAIWHRAASTVGPDEDIAGELEQAAAQAHRRGAVSTAVVWLQRAAALSPDPEAHAARLLSAAEAAYELGRYPQVQAIKAKVAGMPLRARDRSRLIWLEGVFHDGATSEPAEIRHVVELARRATSDDDVDLALQLLIGAARRVWWRDPGETVRTEIVAAVGEVPLPPHDPRKLAVLGLSESMDRIGPIVDGLAHWPADAGGRPDLAGLLGIAAFGIGDFPRAIASLSSAVSELRVQGRMSLLAEALAIRAWAEINLGSFDASKSADEAARLADETGQSVWGATARIAVALIDAVRGGWEKSNALLAAAETTALQMPNASSSLLAGAQLARGMAALGADLPEPAYGDLSRIFVPKDPAWQRVQQLWTVSYLAEAAVRTGRREEAGSVLNSMEQLAGPAPAIGTLIGLEFARAVLADDDSADELYRIALDGAARAYPWHVARLQLAHGSWLRRHRRIVDSRGPLRAARGTFDTLGAHSWAHRADHELRATGERGWRPAMSLREQLSPQETQIAELAAQGFSNREIGQRLFLSHRTVSSHLYRIFPKLGITSRNHLSGVLARDHATGPSVI